MTPNRSLASCAWYGWIGLLSMFAGALLSPLPARAQDRFAVEAFEPAPIADDSVLNVYGSETLPQGAYSMAATLSYGRRPLSLESGRSGKTLGDLVGSVGSLTLMGGVGLWKRLDLGVALPLHRVSKGSDFDDAAPLSIRQELMESTEVALGDLRLVPRVNLLAREQSGQGMGLSFMLPLFLPTGKSAYYAGEPFRVEPRLALDWLFRRNLLLAANLGYLVRSATRVLGHRVDDMLRLGVGAELPLVAGVSALAEINSQLNVRSLDFAKADAPTEAWLGVRIRHGGWFAQLGGGPGLVRGLGAPRYRLFASFGYSRKPTAGVGRAETGGGGAARKQSPSGLEAPGGSPEPDSVRDAVVDGSAAGSEDAGGGLAEAADTESVVEARTETESTSAIELQGPIFFGASRSKFEAQSTDLLDGVAATLEAHPEIKTLVIRGHTDDRGSAARNFRLSRRRAAAVRRALVERGVGPVRLRAEGHGPLEPIAPNDSEEGRAKNRRVELRIEAAAQAR